MHHSLRAVSVWQGFPCLWEVPVMHKPMEEDREMLVPRASTAGQQARKICAIPKEQLGQDFAYGSVVQEYLLPHP